MIRVPSNFVVVVTKILFAHVNLPSRETCRCQTNVLMRETAHGRLWNFQDAPEEARIAQKHPDERRI